MPNNTNSSILLCTLSKFYGMQCLLQYCKNMTGQVWSGVHLTLPQSLNILRYPSLKFWESGVILGTVKSGLEKLQIRSKTCKCVRNLVNTRLMFANTLEKLKMVDMEDDLIHLMVLRRKPPGINS